MKALPFLMLLHSPAHAHDIAGLPLHDAVHWGPVTLGLLVILGATRLALAKVRP